MRVLGVDIVESLLDLRALDPAFATVFGDPRVRQPWFQQMLPSALVSTVTDAYREVRLIAPHTWDGIGATRAGCAAACVVRPNMVADPAGEQPDVVGADLREVADGIIARERG